MSKVLLKSYNFDGDGIYSVDLYSNMISIKRNTLENLYHKNYTEKAHIYFKNLQGIQQGSNYIEFIINGFPKANESIIEKKMKSNVITFNDNEKNNIEELINLINRYM